MSFSGKLPNNTIGSFEFGTEIEDNTSTEEALFEKVYKSTMADIKKSIKENPAIGIIWKEFMSGLGQAKKFQEASEQDGNQDN
jgi:hypothetical protein